jgi:hypothetical protein
MLWFDLWYPVLYTALSCWSELLEQTIETAAEPLRARERVGQTRG